MGANLIFLFWILSPLKNALFLKMLVFYFKNDNESFREQEFS